MNEKINVKRYFITTFTVYVDVKSFPVYKWALCFHLLSLCSFQLKAIYFTMLSGTGRLISLCDDNSLHLWEINEKSLVELKSYIFEGKNKKVSSMCVESSGKHLLLGTEGGNIYSLDLTTFAITDDVIYQDVVMQKLVNFITLHFPRFIVVFSRKYDTQFTVIHQTFHYNSFINRFRI